MPHLRADIVDNLDNADNAENVDNADNADSWQPPFHTHTLDGAASLEAHHVEPRYVGGTRGRHGTLRLRGSSLLTAKLSIRTEGDHVAQSWRGASEPQAWFVTTDRVALQGRVLTPLGRTTDWVKVSGDGVDLGRLQAQVEVLSNSLGVEGDVAVVAMPDARRGHVLVLAHTGAPTDAHWALLTQLRARALVHERPAGLARVDAIPRSALGKLLRGQVVVDPGGIRRRGE